MTIVVNIFIRSVTTLIIPISEGGTNSRHMHNLAKPQSYRGLKLLPSDIKFMNTCSFTVDFKKISSYM